MFILVFLTVFAFGAFIRLYNFNSFSTLTAETAQHYLEMIKLLDGQFLLVSPLTSHSWFRVSSAPYYLFFPLFALFRFHPMTLTYIWTALSILIIPLNYFVVKKIFDFKTALISTILISISPIYLQLHRIPGFFSFIIPLFYILLLFLYFSIKNKNRKIWPVLFLVSLMSSLHAAAFMLVVFFTGLFLILKKFKKHQAISNLSALVIPQIPFIIKDSFSGFHMTKIFLLWIPYKFVNFLTGKTFGLGKSEVTDTTLDNIFYFFKFNFVPVGINWVYGFLIVLAICIYFVWKRSIFEKILFYWLLFGLTVLLIHKNPPLHYFIPILILPIILISRILAVFTASTVGKVFVTGLIIAVVIINLNFIFSDKYLFYDPKNSPEFVPYDVELKVIDKIVKDSGGKKFTLLRKGPFDNYPGQFKQNYEYLLWWKGNRPVENSKLNYLIVENKDSIIVYRNIKVLETLRRDF